MESLIIVGWDKTENQPNKLRQTIMSCVCVLCVVRLCLYFIRPTLGMLYGDMCLEWRCHRRGICLFSHTICNADTASPQAAVETHFKLSYGSLSLSHQSRGATTTSYNARSGNGIVLFGLSAGCCRLCPWAHVVHTWTAPWH